MLRHGFMSAIPPGLELSAEERGRIFAVFLEFIRRRAALEAGMSRVEKMPGGGLLVVIPPYLEIGRQMRRDFYSAVEFAAAEKSAAVRAGMGDFFDLSLRGFGATTQQIEVTADSARLGFYRIQWFAEGTEGLDLSHRKWLPPTPPMFSGTYYLPLSQMDGVGLGYLPAVIARNSP